MTTQNKCDHCGEAFAPKQWFQKYCSAYCRLLAFRKRKRLIKEEA